MADPVAYALLDCGDGRRLEAFGGFLADRPAPTAGEAPRHPDRWAGAATYQPGDGWRDARGDPLDRRDAPVELAGVTLIARPTPSGNVGIFPEHAENAGWVRAAVARRRPAAADGADEAPEVLHLFAHTGLLTLVAASVGAAVVHLDASRPAVAWARENAERSGLADRPIRWITDDAEAFVRREARRGRRYAGIILDPPSYGHGRRGRAGRGASGGRAWQLDDDLLRLLDALGGVAEPDAFWLLTTHSPGWDEGRLAATLSAAIDADPADVDGRSIELRAVSGAVLPLGAAAAFDPRSADRR